MTQNIVSFVISSIGISCGLPVVDSNTVQEGNDTLYEDTVSFSCVTGYIPVNGSATIVCQSDMSWNDTSLFCVVNNCGTPDQQPNTTVSYGTNDYEAFANYTCDEGYEKISGNESRICTASGSWSGSALECGSKYFKLSIVLFSTDATIFGSHNLWKVTDMLGFRPDVAFKARGT